MQKKILVLYMVTVSLFENIRSFNDLFFKYVSKLIGLNGDDTDKEICISFSEKKSESLGYDDNTSFTDMLWHIDLESYAAILVYADHSAFGKNIKKNQFGICERFGEILYTKHQRKTVSRKFHFICILDDRSAPDQNLTKKSIVENVLKMPLDYLSIETHGKKLFNITQAPMAMIAEFAAALIVENRLENGFLPNNAKSYAEKLLLNKNNLNSFILMRLAAFSECAEECKEIKAFEDIKLLSGNVLPLSRYQNTYEAKLWHSGTVKCFLGYASAQGNLNALSITAAVDPKVEFTDAVIKSVAETTIDRIWQTICNLSPMIDNYDPSTKTRLYSLYLEMKLLTRFDRDEVNKATYCCDNKYDVAELFIMESEQLMFLLRNKHNFDHSSIPDILRPYLNDPDSVFDKTAIKLLDPAGCGDSHKMTKLLTENRVRYRPMYGLLYKMGVLYMQSSKIPWADPTIAANYFNAALEGIRPNGCVQAMECLVQMSKREKSSRFLGSYRNILIASEEDNKEAFQKYLKRIEFNCGKIRKDEHK